MRTPLKYFLRRSAVFAFILTSFGAWAAGETSGRLAGTVYDPTGAPLGSVPLTLTSAALQGPAFKDSGDDGNYSFNSLSPATDYALEVNIPGFAPIKQTGITVNLGRTTTVDVKLSVLTETRAETYEIKAKVNPMMATDSAQATTVVTFEKAAQTPIFHQVERVASQVPGVGPGTRPSTRGGLTRYSKFYVDGMDTTDVTDGAITAPMNYDVVEQFEVITGGFDAQYNSLGAVTNAVTKSGGNTFKYDVNVTASPPWMTAQNAIPGNQQALAGTYGETNTTRLPQTYFYSPVVALTGPIIKDKLWFAVSGQMNLNRRESLISTPYSAQETRPTDTLTTLLRGKLTWQATTKDRLSVAFNYDRNVIDNVIGNGSVTLDAEQKIDRGGFFVIANYDHSFTDALLFQLQAGVTHKSVSQGPGIDTGLVSHFDSSQRVSQFSSGQISSDNQGNFLNESKQRVQFDPMILWNLGRHQIKAGIQVSYQRSLQLQGVTTTQRYTDRNGVCNIDDPTTFSFCNQHIDFYNSDGQLAPQRSFGSVFGPGFFVQDRFTLNKYLTLIGGLRLDLGSIAGNDGKVLGTLVGVGPRLAATWDILGDRKTIVTGHYGRSNDVGNILVAQHANPSLTQVTSTFANGTFANCTLNVNATGCQQTGGSRSLTIGAPPSVDEVAVGVKREIFEQTAVGIDFSYRKYSNMWADRETNAVYDSTGTRVVSYANGQSQSVLEGITSSQASREYKGMDVWVQGNPGNFDLLASYTLSQTTGTVDDYFSSLLINPRYTQFYEGPSSDDRRHAFKGSLTYRTSFGLDLGLRFQYFSGTPVWESFPNAFGGVQRVYRSPRGTGFANDAVTGLPNLNDATQWVNLRNPDQLTLDLQARYNLSEAFGIKAFRMEIIALVVNATNSTQATFLSDVYNPGGTNRFGTATGRAAPLQGELILRVRN
jgi:hypothetical protein